MASLSKVGLSTISLAGAAWAMFVIARRSWRLFTFGDNQLLRFVKPSTVGEVASIFFIISVGILTASLTAIVLIKLSNRRRVGPHREAKSIPEFTSKLRARPDEIAQTQEEPEKRRERLEKQRERELEKWREEHRAQLERG